MIGNWKWNVAAALASGLLTLLLSWPRNPVATSFGRALIAFVIWFAAVYAVRRLWGFALGADARAAGAKAEPGRNVDLATPADEEALLQEMLAAPPGSEPKADEFVPLQPERLVTRDKLDPERLARSVRQMSED